MDRRQALEALGAAGAAGLSLTGCESETPKVGSGPGELRKPGFSFRFFTREQALAVEDLAERLIPEGQTPGARSAGVARFVESVVADVYEEGDQERFVQGLAALDDQARAAHDRPFVECTPAEQTALARALSARAAAENEKARQLPRGERPPAPFWSRFRSLAIEGFCNSRLGATRVLAYEDVPGAYKGCIPLARAGKTWATW